MITGAIGNCRWRLPSLAIPRHQFAGVATTNSAPAFSFFFLRIFSFLPT